MLALCMVANAALAQIAYRPILPLPVLGQHNLKIMTESEQPVDIESLIPHRHPMLLVERDRLALGPEHPLPQAILGRRCVCPGALPGLSSRSRRHPLRMFAPGRRDLTVRPDAWG